MTEDEMISYYDNNLEQIFKNDLITDKLDFIGDFISDQRIQQLLKSWPDDIKIKVVEKYLYIEDINAKESDDEHSWSEYYEMYDGKFDEKSNLQIIIKKDYLNKLAELGYKSKKRSSFDSNPHTGEFHFDENENIVITHSCPDREIFAGDLKQHLDELGIKPEWVLMTALTEL
tara:strand:+ start:47 stop:565 length:519 start_codon:yes stop_codon:yes gene_type:complete